MTIRHLESLFRPAAVLAIGTPADTAASALHAQLAQQGLLHTANHGAELAVIFDAAALTPARVHALTAQGCRGLLWLAEAPVPDAILQAGRDEILRVLGPRTLGTGSAGGLALSAWPTPASGHTALIAQSRSIAAAALDWAAGQAIGLSWFAVSGGEADVDAGDLLDYAALDPQTRAVLLQVSQIRSPRKFMSAARACARAKPVVVLQTPDTRDAAHVATDPARSAAFRRAGLVEVDRVTALFSALTALDRVGDALHGRIAVAGSGSGVCQLARAALWREQLQSAAIGTDTRTRIAEAAPAVRAGDEWLDLGLADDRQTLAALQLAMQDPEIDALMLVRGALPGRDDLALAERLVAAGLRERLVVAVLGHARTSAALQRCNQAGIAAFASVEAAARALRYRGEHRRTQELLMRTPARAAALPNAALPAFAPGVQELAGVEVEALLAAYGLRAAPADHGEARGLRVRFAVHSQLGLTLRVRLEPASGTAPSAFALPPLDDVLSASLLGELGLHGDEQTAPGLRIGDYAQPLQALAQLAIDLPRLHELDLRLLPGARCEHARLRLDAQALPERTRLALAPYPQTLQTRLALADGEALQLRAVRPSDEPALLAMLSAVDREDIRLRFFRYIRQFTHAMAARMTQIDYDREMSFVAETADGALAGIVTLVADPTGASGEFAVLVHADGKRRGLGRALMQHLLAYAAARGIREVWGDVLIENRAMLGLAQKLGFTRERHAEDYGCVRIVRRLNDGVSAQPGVNA